MKARLRKLLSDLGETFWLLPATIVMAGILLAFGLVHLDRSGAVPQWLIDSPWLYSGGGTGARTLLGAVASSTIGVAGTVFSITIAALSLAAGQMGPRLLRNFTRDRGNQTTLGVFLGTFSYALMVLRSVRTQSEGAFVPHLSLSVGILLAFVCVGTLVYFVGHMAGRINVDTVIELVGDEVRQAIARLTAETPGEQPPPVAAWHDAVPVRYARRGYLQQIDPEGLAGWAHRHGAAIRLLVPRQEAMRGRRPGTGIDPCLLRRRSCRHGGSPLAAFQRRPTMMKTSVGPTALAVAGFLALAGCSSGDNHPMTQSRSVAPVATATAAPVPAGTPEVSPGMIKRIQTALRQQGLYKGRIDGQWGPQTQSAIGGYQQAHNLTNNGEIDSPTLASLQIASVSSAPPVQTAMPQTVPPPVGTTN